MSWQNLRAQDGEVSTGQTPRKVYGTEQDCARLLLPAWVPNQQDEFSENAKTSNSNMPLIP